MNGLVVELFVLCERFAADEQGRAVLERVVGNLVKDTFPAAQTMALYAEVWGTPFGTPRVQIRVRAPDGQVVFSPAVDGFALDDEGVALFGMPIENLPLPAPGVYAAELHVDGEVLARRRFLVSRTPGKTAWTASS